MLIYSTNHSQGLLHYVEQKRDVTDNREERTHAHFQRHTPALIKCKPWKTLTHCKKKAWVLMLVIISIFDCPLQSPVTYDSAGEQTEGTRKNKYPSQRANWNWCWAGSFLCYLAEGRCQWSTVLFVLQIIFVIVRCFILWRNRSLFSVWIAISSSLNTTQKLSLKYKSFSSNLCRMFFAQVCALKTLFAVQCLNYIRYVASFLFFSWN